MKKLLGLMFLLCFGSIYAALPIPADSILPAATTENTIVMDRFNNATSGENHGYASYTESLPGLGMAADFTHGSSFNIYQIPANLKATGTVEMWIFPKKYGKGIFNMNWDYATSNPSFGHVFHLILQNNGKIGLSGWNFEGINGFESTDSIPLNKWTHVAVSWGDSTKIYLNGKVNLVSELPYRPEVTNPVNYGYAPYWGDSIGYMDELHVSNMQLPNEVIASRSANYVPVVNDIAFHVTVPEATNQCWVVGNFNSWNNNQYQLTKIDQTNYTITIPEAELNGYTKETLSYKYLSGGGDWAYVEKGFLGEEIPDRTFTASDTVQSWANIYVPGSVPIEKDVYIEAYVPKSVSEMYLTGNYINWTNPGVDGTRMDLVPEKCDSNGNYFSKMIHVYDFATLAYRFAAGPYWSYQQLGEDNRVTDLTADTLFHNQLSFIRIYPGIENTQTVQITVNAPKGTRDVYLMGSHVNWDGVQWQQGVKQTDGSFIFEIPHVDVFEYRYYREANWSYDEKDLYGAPRANRSADILVSLTYADVIDRWDDTWVPEPTDTTNYIIPANIPTQGLMGWWPFNGNALDESGYENHGQINNVYTEYDRFGNPNSAYYFYQGNIKLPNQQIVNSLPHTISVWAKAPVRYDPIPESIRPAYPNNIISNDVPLHYGHGIGMNFNNQTSYATLEYHDDFVRLSNLNIYPDQWHHWVMVYDYNNIKLYLDNVLVMDSYVTENEFDSNDYILVGQHNSDFDTYNERLFFYGHIDDIAIWNRALSYEEIVKVNGNREISISVPQVMAGTNDFIYVPVKSNILFDSDSILSYQFVMNYNPDVLNYSGAYIPNTMSGNGEIVVNSEVPGKLEVAYMSNYHITGQGDLLFLMFNTQNMGYSQLDISDFLYNTEPVYNVTDGSVTVNTTYGDVDNNTLVQAYDAALVLQYSVGFDPMPVIDPYPWEEWRINAGDVDDSYFLSAYDAGLILQKTVHLIDLFPVEEQYNPTLRAPALNNVDLIITKDAENLYFKSYGNLIGLNVSLENNFAALGTPKFYQTNIIKAVNISTDKYEVGMATAVAAADGSTILSIPINQTDIEDLTLKLRLNNLEKYVKFGVITQESSVWETAVQVLPNPVKDKLIIQMGGRLFNGKSIRINNLTGQMIYAESLSQEKTVINMNQFAQPGIYMLQIVDENENIILTRKLIKE